jgi:four helix bundle protein
MTDKPTQYHSYKDLQVWQKSLDFCAQVIDSVQALKSNERQLLGEVLLSASFAVPSLIANGYSSRSKITYIDSLKAALNQLSVIETVMLSAQMSQISLGLELDTVQHIRIMLAKLTSSLTNKGKEPKAEATAEE